ncbi:unnamed protein product [Rhizoctonia solani]|uniref:Uncharacterized protein n=1 Tax=Rhizoctonia solani TaxID=456999 RepID=A0A8H3E1U8_9AGAM|nr:unnamed protein product [Rhizoctonia solani]
MNSLALRLSPRLCSTHSVWTCLPLCSSQLPLFHPAPLPLVLSGLASADGAYLQTKNISAFESQGVSPIARAAMRNFAIALHGAILVDIGSTVGLDLNSNILTNLAVLKSRIQTDQLLGTFMTQTVGSANGLYFSIPVAPIILSNSTEFRLPITARQVGTRTRPEW